MKRLNLNISKFNFTNLKKYLEENHQEHYYKFRNISIIKSQQISTYLLHHLFNISTDENFIFVENEFHKLKLFNNISVKQFYQLHSLSKHFTPEIREIPKYSLEELFYSTKIIHHTDEISRIASVNMSIHNKDGFVHPVESEKFENVRFCLKINFFNIYINPLLKINFSINRIIKFNDNNISSPNYIYKNKETNTNKYNFKNQIKKENNFENRLSQQENHIKNDEENEKSIRFNNQENNFENQIKKENRFKNQENYNKNEKDTIFNNQENNFENYEENRISQQENDRDDLEIENHYKDEKDTTSSQQENYIKYDEENAIEENHYKNENHIRFSHQENHEENENHIKFNQQEKEENILNDRINNDFYDKKENEKDINNYLENDKITYKMSLDMSTGLYVSDELFNITEYGQYEIIFHINLSEKNSGKFSIKLKENIFVSVPFFVSVETENSSNIINYGSSIKISCFSPNHLYHSQVYFKLFDPSLYLLKKEKQNFSSDEIIFYHEFSDDTVVFPGTIRIVVEVEDTENGIHTIRELKNILFNSRFEIENYSISNSFNDIYSLKILPRIVCFNNNSLYIPNERVLFFLKLTSLSHEISMIEGIPLSYEKFSYIFNFKVSETIDFVLDFRFILYINNGTYIPLNITSPFSNKKLVLSQLKTNFSSTENVKYKVKHGDNLTLSFFVLDEGKGTILNSLHSDIFVYLFHGKDVIKAIKCIQHVNGIFECNIFIDSLFEKGLVSTSISVFDKNLSSNEIIFDVVTNISFSLSCQNHHHILTLYSECVSDENVRIYGGNFEYYVYDERYQFIMKLKSSSEHNFVSLPDKYTPCRVILRFDNREDVLAEIFIGKNSFFKNFLEDIDIEYIFVLLSFTLFTFSIYLRYHL